MIMKINLFHVFIFLFMSISTNSNAQSYKKGDVNQDGKVDISDVVAVINIMAHGGGDETFTVNGVSFTMIYVNGGTFMMGATSEQGSEASDSEKPAHSVTLSSFCIGQTEVTQELWEAVMGTNPSNSKGANLPVRQVSWDDCQTFIAKLNSLTGQQFRLPTEAEWEYAARGGNQSKGYKYSGSNNVGVVAWYDYNSSGKIHEVAAKAPNELSIYDMSGNVWEWCQDWYGSYSTSAQTNPTGPLSGSSRVNRGGSGLNDARLCRVAFRGDASPDYRDSRLGFRLAL
jgi:formylglycine-generating enzyme required for sulfatase activity